MKNGILINVTGKPVFQTHLSWTYQEFTDKGQSYIVLYELVKATYKHPEAPDHAVIERIEHREIKRCLKTESNAAPIMLLKYALEYCTQIFKP